MGDQNVTVLLPPGDLREDVRPETAYEVAGAFARQRLREFFRNFRQGNVYQYRDSLVRNWNRGEYFVEVDLAHVNEYDEVLFNKLQTNPGDFMPLFELAAKDALLKFLHNDQAQRVQESNIPDFQIILKSAQLPQSLRNLTAEHVNKLVKVNKLAEPFCF